MAAMELAEMLFKKGAEARSLSGVYPGTVVNTVDIEGLGRVQVMIPRISIEFVSNWARVAAPMTGNHSGAYFRPEIGDEVLVAFDGGDINVPYVIGSLWNSRMLPPVPGYDPAVIEMRSRNMETPPPPLGLEGAAAVAEQLAETVARTGEEAALEAEETAETAEEAPDEGSAAEGEAEQEAEEATEVAEEATESVGGMGNTIRLDSRLGQSRIEIIDETGGNRIVIDCQTNTILINANMNIEMNAQQAIIMNAPTIALNGTADVNVNSDGAVTISSTEAGFVLAEGLNVAAGAEISCTAGANISLAAGGASELSAAGDINIAGGGAVNGEAGGEISLDAGGAFNAEAGAEASIAAGAVVNIEAAGEAGLAGAIVLINE